MWPRENPQTGAKGTFETTSQMVCLLRCTHTSSAQLTSTKKKLLHNECFLPYRCLPEPFFLELFATQHLNKEVQPPLYTTILWCTAVNTMSSTSPCKKPSTGCRYGFYLPADIRDHILQFLMQDGCTLGGLATVSREWQAAIEKHTFSLIKLTSARLADLDSMVSYRRHLVRNIWFCVELDADGCTKCVSRPAFRGASANPMRAHGTFASGSSDQCQDKVFTAFQNLFSSLSKWEAKGDLTLDISIHPPNGSEHWFKYLSFVPDTSTVYPTNNGLVRRICYDPYRHTSRIDYDHREHGNWDYQHRWIIESRAVNSPLESALRGMFAPFIKSTSEWPFYHVQAHQLEWLNQLPVVPAVTKLLLRQQNHWRLPPRALAHLVARLPGLQELHYEPWRVWYHCVQEAMDKGNYTA